MTISPVREIVILSLSLISGYIIGLIYDVLRRIKRYLGFNSLLVDIGDVITFVLLSVCAYMSVYIINDGKVRWYEIFGIFSGFFMYMSYLSSFVVRFLEFVEGMILGLFKVSKKIVKPVFKLIMSVKNVFNRFFSGIKLKIISKNRKKSRFFCKIRCIFRKI